MMQRPEPITQEIILRYTNRASTASTILDWTVQINEPMPKGKMVKLKCTYVGFASATQTNNSANMAEVRLYNAGTKVGWDSGYGSFLTLGYLRTSLLHTTGSLSFAFDAGPSGLQHTLRSIDSTQWRIVVFPLTTNFNNGIPATEMIVHMEMTVID